MSAADQVAEGARGVVQKVSYLWAPRAASWLRKQWVILRNPQATIRFEGPVYLGPGFSLHMPDGGTFVVGPGVEFRRGFRADMGGNARITIGAGCTIDRDPVFACHTSIEIGERCSIGHCAYVVDGNHRFRDLDRPMLAQGYDYTPIVIEDDVQIASKVTVINRIGTRAIVEPNTVVTKPIPAFTVAGGVPARVRDYFGPPGGEPEDWEGTASRSSR
ncbi:MAG: acyltransferase [Actinomycetota bacterium]|nr:acyltransferase [Actinomycetota bacterium]